MPKSSWVPAPEDLGSWVKEVVNSRQRCGPRVGIIVGQTCHPCDDKEVKSIDVLFVNVLQLSSSPPKLVTYEQVSLSVNKSLNVKPWEITAEKRAQFDELFSEAFRNAEVVDQEVDENTEMTNDVSAAAGTDTSAGHQQPNARRRQEIPKEPRLMDLIAMGKREPGAQPDFESPEKKRRIQGLQGLVKCDVEVQWFHKSKAFRMATLGKGRISKQGLAIEPDVVNVQGFVRDVAISKNNIVKVSSNFVHAGKATFVVKDSEDSGGTQKLFYIMVSKAQPELLAAVVDMFPKCKNGH